jgi:ParB family chromosome partitioning protein
VSGGGHVELDWAVDGIRTGPRVRQELGDLATLVESIATYGLLQPITISPDGLLLCGARRLAAVRQLGLRTVNVWIRNGISSRLHRLIAEQVENTLRQPLLPTEAAALYREMKQVLAEDAARRQEATRFGAPASDDPSSADSGAVSGAAKLAAPRGSGDTRRQAARQVTGGNSYSTLERVGEVQRAADDQTLPDEVRALAKEALTGMDRDGKVNGYYQQVRNAVAHARQQQLEALADEAIARATSANPAPAQPASPGTTPRGPRRLRVRAFLLTWNELDGWTDQYDPAEIGPALTTSQWETFTRTVDATLAFLDQARTARTRATVTGVS